MKAFNLPQVSTPVISSITPPKAHYGSFHFAYKPCKYKDTSLKHHRKYLYYIREFHFLSGAPSNGNQHKSFNTLFRHSSFKTLFKVLQKIHLKVKKLDMLEYLFRTKRTLSCFTLELERTKISREFIKQVITKSSNSRVKEFAIWREIGEFKALEFADFIRQLAFFPSLEILTILVDYAPLCSLKGPAANSLESAFTRLSSIKEVNFNYKLASLSKECTRAIGRIFSKLPKLKEFRPKLLLSDTNSSKELDFMQNLSGSKSLEVLNMALDVTTLENTKTLAHSINELISLKKLIISMMCHQVIAVENPLWTTIQSFNRLEELHLDIKFFRTSNITDEFFRNFAGLGNLVHLKTLNLVIKDKRNSQTLQRMWETLIPLKNLRRLKLTLKNFKLMKEDYKLFGDVIQSPKHLKELELNCTEMGFHVEKEFFHEISRGISSKEREETMERLCLRFEVGNGTIMKDVLHGKYKNLKRFDFEGEVHGGSKGNCKELRSFIEMNCSLKEVSLKFRNRKEKEKEDLFKRNDMDSYIMDKRSLEEIFGATKKLTDVEKLELVLGQLKRSNRNIDSILELVKELPKLKEIKMDFPRAFLNEKELTEIILLCKRKIFRRVEVKDSIDKLSNHTKSLVKDMNTKYGNIKDPKEGKV